MRKREDNQGRGEQGRPGAARDAEQRQRRAGASFEARFGRVILQHGVAAIPAGLYHYQGRLGLDAKHLWFVSYILSCKWDQDLPYPSLNRMEKRTGVEIQALYRYKKALTEQGYLHVIKRYTEQGGKDSNAYDFTGLFERLEELIATEPSERNAIRSNSYVPDPVELAEIDSSFVARYGRVIVRYGVAVVPRAVFTHQRALGLTPQQVWFITYIFSFKWDTAMPYPSIEKMAFNTGYSRAYLHEIKSSLVAGGYLRLVHRTNELGGQDTNAYDFSPLLDMIREQLDAESSGSPAPEPLSEQATGTEQYVPRRRGRQAALAKSGKGRRQREDISEQTGPAVIAQTAPPVTEPKRAGITQRTGVDIDEMVDPGITEQTRVGVTQQRGPGFKRQTAPIRPLKSTDVAAGRQGDVSRGVHESEAGKAEKNQEDDSNQLPRVLNRFSPTRDDDTPLPFSPYIAAVVTDFSDELGDPQHITSNVTQVLRIWKNSELSEQDFSELLFEARKRVRLYQGKQGLGTINKKMAYFFTVLRDLSEGQQ